MSECVITCAWYAAIIAAFFGLVYWLADKLIDRVLPADESQAKRDMEALLADANKQAINRPRVRAGIFSNWRKS